MKRSKVLFENHQWQVTDYGMESVKPAPTYHFNAERLLEERGSGDGDIMIGTCIWPRNHGSILGPLMKPSQRPLNFMLEDMKG